MRKLKVEELNRPDVETYQTLEKIKVCVVMDNIRSMYNVGAVFRTADAFLIEKIYLCGITAQPPHKEIRKTALGATESVEWEYYKDTFDVIQELKSEGYKICSVEQAEGSKPLQYFKPNTEDKWAIVMGNEIDGVAQEIIDESDVCIELPQFGTKHSLNVSVCSGIIMWSFFEQMKLK